MRPWTVSSARPRGIERFSHPALPVTNALEVGLPHAGKKRIAADALPCCEARPKQHDAAFEAKRRNVHDASFTHLPEKQVDQLMANRLPFGHDPTSNPIRGLNAPLVADENRGNDRKDLSPWRIQGVCARLADLHIPAAGISKAVCVRWGHPVSVVTAGNAGVHRGHGDMNGDPEEPGHHGPGRSSHDTA